MKTELRTHRCCFTGHRPEKLTMPEHKVKAALETQIRAAIGNGFQTFISGLSPTANTFCAHRKYWMKDALGRDSDFPPQTPP